jgi:cell division protein FtsB
MSSPAMPLRRTRIPRLAEAAAERARLTVVPRRRTTAPRMPFVALVSLLLLAGVVGLLLFNTSMQQASFAQTALENQADTLAAREQTLRMELDDLRNPQRIADRARDLGMVLPKNPVFLDLGAGAVVGAPFVASHADGQRIDPPRPAKPAALNPKPHVVTSGVAGDNSRDTAGNATPGTAADGRNGTQQSQQSQETQGR